MIVYALTCPDGHRFDAWFRNSDVCDAQLASDEVSCTQCGSHKIAKAPMAPAVRSSRRSVEPGSVEPGSGEPAGGDMVLDPAKVAALQALGELKKRIEADCDYVGDRFAEEARRIHYGEVEAHGIYGETSDSDARALHEEGIEVARIPWVRSDA
jgi:hypothetical protein